MKTVINDFKQDSKRIKTIVISTVIWGFLAHGSVMFNLYSFFDNADLFNIGSTFELGRWFLGFMSWLTMYFSGSLLYVTPLLYGALTILVIGMSSYLLANLLEIKKTLLLILLNGLMIVFPAVTSTLGYMFTAPYYFIGIFVGILGIYIFFYNKKIYTWIISVLLLSFGAGTYQANMHIFIGIILLITIKDTYKHDHSFNKFVIYSLINLSLCIGMLVVYLVINNIVLKMLNLSMTGYKNINGLGDVQIGEYFNRIILAYKEFFNPTNNVSRNMYVFSLMQFYKILLVLVFIVLFFCLVIEFRKSITKTLELIILFLFIPLANNFVYLMCETEFVYSIMMYGQLTVFILLIYFMEHIEINNQALHKATYSVSVTLLSVFCVLYTKFDNNCYLKADILQRQINSYITTIVTQIKSMDEYHDGMKITYINEENKRDSSIPHTEELDSIYIHPYHMSSLIEDYHFRRIMERQIGFYPEKIDSKQFESLEEVVNMPSYPNSGSIKIINDVIVVKFSDK